MMTEQLKKHLASLVLFESSNSQAQHCGYDSGCTKEDIATLGLYLLEQAKKIEVLRNHIRRGADKEGHDLDFLARFDTGTAWELSAGCTTQDIETIEKLKTGNFGLREGTWGSSELQMQRLTGGVK